MILYHFHCATLTAIIISPASTIATVIVINTTLAGLIIMKSYKHLRLPYILGCHGLGV